MEEAKKTNTKPKRRSWPQGNIFLILTMLATVGLIAPAPSPGSWFIALFFAFIEFCIGAVIISDRNDKMFGKKKEKDLWIDSPW